MTGQAHIGCDWDGALIVGFPFDEVVKNQIKALPGARWSPGKKAWTVPAWLLPQVERILSDAGMLPPPQSKRESSTSTKAPAGNWAEIMFRALPAHLREPVFKALVRVLHPDVGGDGRAAQVLNDAYNSQRVA